jgi:3-isopropylmalate/(R)-2-methylmalate dehydratase large subunit
MNASPRTLYQKLWDDHCVEMVSDTQGLLWIDRQLLYEATSFQALHALEQRAQSVFRPKTALAVPDHLIPTHRRDRAAFHPPDLKLMDAMIERCNAQGIPVIPLEDDRQGIVHVIGPEQGFTVPGITLVCCDSHTCTNGALGALAFGIGSSDFEHVLVTQTLLQTKLKSMRVNIRGRMGPGFFAKDLILAVIGRIGHDGGVGHAIEFAGEVIESLSMEGRMTICNMAVEAGARSGLIAPDETTISFVKGRPMAPTGAAWDEAAAYWRTLASDPGATFDKEIDIDVSGLAPQVTWGTSPEHVTGIDRRVPSPTDAPDPARRSAWEKAQEYMSLTPGTALQKVRIDRAFIGSCTNSRIEDLRAAAEIARGRRVADHVRAIVSPGSGLIRRAAEKEGLDRIFIEAGFQWRLPGCSMCFANVHDGLSAGERCASTSNRNFEHRQGVGGRTHLMSPAMVAAAAISGRLFDVREFVR